MALLLLPAASASSPGPGLPVLQPPLVAAGAPSSPSSAQPPPTIQDGIGPGSALQMSSDPNSFYLCSAAFLLRDPATATYYLSTAGHCLVDNPDDPHPYTGADHDKVRLDVKICKAGCLDNALSLGTYLDLHDDGDYHPVAYAESGGVGQDFGIIQLPPEAHADLRPAIPQWGGPKGIDPSQSGDLLVLYGHGTYCCPVVGGAVSRTPADQGRTGVSLGTDGTSFSAVGWTSGGDSGSGVAIGIPDATGVAHGAQAVGVLTHGIAEATGEFAGTLLPHGLDMVAKATGLHLQLVEEGDPLSAAPDPNATVQSSASIAIVRPAAGATVIPSSGTVAVAGTAAVGKGAPGNGTRIEVSMDDPSYGLDSRLPVSGNGSWSATWYVGHAAAGNHTLHARLVGPDGTLAETARTIRLAKAGTFAPAPGATGSKAHGTTSASHPGSTSIKVPALPAASLVAALAVAAAAIRRRR
jgi:hypothetical protein